MNETPLTLHLPTLLNARNERNIIKSEFVDLSAVVDIIEGYISVNHADDPFVHSATILRIAALDIYFEQLIAVPFEKRLAMMIIHVILEGETWKVGDVNTPDERLEEIFTSEQLTDLRGQLAMTPVICTRDEFGTEIRVPDLFSLTFLARPMGTIAETSKDIIAREERRLFRPNDETIRCELVDECDVVGEPYEISEYDEWASATDFPWDEHFVDGEYNKRAEA